MNFAMMDFDDHVDADTGDWDMVLGVSLRFN